jgi:hypothetical protein
MQFSAIILILSKVRNLVTPMSFFYAKYVPFSDSNGRQEQHKMLKHRSVPSWSVLRCAGRSAFSDKHMIVYNNITNKSSVCVQFVLCCHCEVIMATQIKEKKSHGKARWKCDIDEEEFKPMSSLEDKYGPLWTSEEEEEEEDNFGIKNTQEDVTSVMKTLSLEANDDFG